MTDEPLRSILIAGVGNAWLRDDGFGGEVARRLTERTLPDGVSVMDAGTGGLDLAYEVMRGYDALVILDVSKQGGEPGTLYVMEPDEESVPGGIEDGDVINPHSMDPQTVLRFAYELSTFLLRFEAGLAAGAEYKIRAPLSRTPAGAISFACGVPEGAVIRITESAPKDQIESAREAARRAKVKLDGRPAAGAIVFDCICRNLILKDAFGSAVRAMVEELGGVPLAGFETYGEIALDAGDMSGFHNTTSVVLAFPR